MEAIHMNQAEIIDAMTKLASNIKKDSSGRKVGDYFKRRLETLEAYWADFQYNHDRLCTEESRSHPYFLQNEYVRAAELYKSVKALINQQQELVKAGQSEVSNEGVQSQKREGEPSGMTIRSMRDEQATGRSFPDLSSRGTSSKTDDMLKKQASNIKAFQRTVASVNLEQISEKWEMEDTLKTLQSRWSVIDTLHWELDGELEEIDEQYEQAYSKQEKIYNDLKKAINIKLWSVAHKVKSTPKLDIPIFYGSYQQWTSFKDLFTETIHNNYSLSNAQKMQHLKSNLKGEPEKLIQHLQISSDNYNISWEILNHRYNNLKLICSSHLDTLLNIPASQYATINHIKRLHDTTIESLNAIKNLGVDVSSWDPLLVHILSPKLDPETYDDYAASIKEPRAIPKLQEFLSFLEGKFTSMESACKKQDISNKSYNTSNFKQASFGGKTFKQNYISQPTSAANIESTTSKNTNSTKNYYKCPICKTNEHGIFYCQQFLDMSPQNRRKTLSRFDVCQNCLYCHNGKACISSKRCRECNGNHNTLLHAAFTQASRTSAAYKAKAGENTTRATSSETPQLSRGNSHVSLQQNMPDVLLPTAIIKVQAEDGSFQNLRALLDQGSQMSLISENAAQILGLSRKKSPGVIWGIGEKESNCKGVMNIKCVSANNNFEFQVDVYIMNKLVKNLPNRTFQKPTWSFLDNITLADPDFNIRRPVDILLGSSVYSKLLLEGVCRETENSASAQNTRLGWIISGDIIQSFQCNVILHNLDDIQQFWEIEDITDKTTLSSGDQHTIDYYQKTTTRLEDGRYQVRLPLKPNVAEILGTSKPKAIAQFKSLERKFKQHPEVQEEYQKFLTEYQELGHMKPASNTLQPDCFLTHHSVLRPDSTTTKLRVVFNASARTSSGVSLNDAMEAGPNLQQDLQSLIIKWRQYKFAYTADIEKMFRQIRIHEDDQRFQKIVWRNSLTEPIQEYQLTTVTYGTKAAPFLSLMTLKQLARDENQNYTNSLATQVLENSFYVDDLLHGSHSPESARNLTRDLIKLLKSGGFNLRKWKSNVPELLNHIPADNNYQENFNFKQAEQTKTLGLIWDPREDNFRFELKIEQTNAPVTKRSLLSDISKLFDPLGWLSPLSTRLKIIFQNVWLSNINWDDSLPEDILNDWMSIRNNIYRVNQLQVPRWICTGERDSIELHGFCDASQKAYACVIYVRIKRSEREQSTPILLVGKTRLVPATKAVSLPRLELSGALLLSKLMSKVQQCLSNYNLSIYGWADSMIVLGWLNGEPTRWKAFVANRVRQITTIIPANSWRYVKSADNPADCASRGLNVSQLEDHSLWWKGPSWLPSYNPEKEPISTFTTDVEIKKNNKLQVNVTTQQNSDGSSVIRHLISKYSSFTQLISVYAMLLRLFNRLKTKEKPQSRYLSLLEIRVAKLKLIKYVQENDFSEEIHKLQQGKHISSKSKILDLNPFLDQDGILRVGGRLKHANIDPQMKHPIILSKNSRVTELIIDESHLLTFHGGPQLTSAFIRQKYWIVGGIRAVKYRVRRCVKCRRHNPINQHQIMGDLPAERTNPSRPFQNVGVDYTGHIFIKANKGRGIKTTKGYVAVFICMATKAVHLELVSDLTTSSFIAALRRMIARRGLPSKLFSDQGTNFIGANKVLQDEYKEIRGIFDEEFQAEITKMGIEWHFNAPSWPSAGGLWEAAVKSLKYHLKRVVGEQKLTFEEFSTILYQLEACLNSRPLCPLTENSSDLNFLTPAHFLSSGPNLTLYETEKDLRTRWNQSQRIYQDIWKRWRGEYLTQLNTRSKWKRPRENIKVGDLTLIHDANLPPGKWAMGRVTQVHPGSDGYVRVVTLQTKNGTMRRPIVKLTPLLECSDEEAYNQVSSPVQQDTSASLKQTQRSRGLNYTLTTIMSLLILLLSFICNVQGAYNITQLQNNQAIYFDKISEMNLIQDQWKIVVYYDMQPYWQGSKIFNIYMKHLENLCTQTENRSHCDVIMLQLRHGFMELEYYDRMLLNQHFEAHTRTRRGLINGIGYVANSLFGVLDEHFAEQYQRDITLIRQNQKHLASLWRNQTSIIEAENNLLKRVEETMEKQHKIFNQHLINLDQAVNKIKNKVEKVAVSEDFILSTLIANNILSSLKNIQDSLLDTITNVQHFNVHLITPTQLQSELNIISNQLPKELSLPINSIASDLYKIYQIMEVRARMTREYFIFEIQIPLVNRENYDIYHMIPIQHQVNRSMLNVILISEYIAINIRKDTYLPISEYELQKCITLNSDTNLCRLQKPIYQRDSDQNFCMKNQEKETCTTITATCKTKWTELNVINTFIITCCDHCTLRIICGDQVTTEQVTGVNIIALGNNCIIKGETFLITSHKQQSIDMKIKPNFIAVEIAPVNNIINLSIPHNEYKEESYQSSLQNISEQIQSMKAASDQVIVDDGVSYHDVHHYVAIYFVGAAGLAFAVCVYIRSRRRRTVQLEPTPVQPSVHYRTSTSDISASGIIHQSDQCASVTNNSSVFVIDRATSPIIRKCSFKTSSNNVAT